MRCDTLTSNRVIVTDANRNFTSSTATTTELNYLSGVTSSIQTQLNNKQSSITASSSITLSNIDLVGTLNAPNYLPSTAYLFASNISTAANSAIGFSKFTTYQNSNVTYASLDSDGKGLTFSTDGLYYVSFVKVVSNTTKTSSPWSLRIYTGITLVKETSPDFKDLDGTMVGMKAGQKVVIWNGPDAQNYTNGNSATPSLWSVVPLSLGFPG
jgi:hypothetical protein